MQLATLFESQYVPIRCRTRSAGTIRLYRLALVQLDRFLGRPAVLADLNDGTISAFLLDYSRGRSPYTVERARTAILAIWRWAARKRIVDVWPDVEPEQLPH